MCTLIPSSLRHTPPSTSPHLGVTCHWKPDRTFFLLTHSPPAAISGDYRYSTISGQSSAVFPLHSAISSRWDGAVPSSGTFPPETGRESQVGTVHRDEGTTCRQYRPHSPAGVYSGLYPATYAGTHQTSATRSALPTHMVLLFPRIHGDFNVRSQYKRPVSIRSPCYQRGSTPCGTGLARLRQGVPPTGCGRAVPTMEHSTTRTAGVHHTRPAEQTGGCILYLMP